MCTQIQTDYAIDILVCLCQCGRKFQSTESVAAQTNVPKNYCVRVMEALEKAQLVESKLGSGGGVRLWKAPWEITLYDVVLATSNKFPNCFGSVSPATAGSRFSHRAHELFRQSTLQSLREITLERLMKDREDKERCALPATIPKSNSARHFNISPVALSLTDDTLYFIKSDRT